MDRVLIVFNIETRASSHPSRVWVSALNFYDGDVWIKALPGGGSEVRYRESVEPELPITPLMARLIKPLVARELRREIIQFLERVRDHLSN